MHDAMNGLEDDWVVKGLIAARLLVDAEGYGRMSDKTVTKRLHDELTETAVLRIEHQDPHLAYLWEKNQEIKARVLQDKKRPWWARGR